MLLYRQRRWWNAYILFYEKVPDKQSDPMENLSNKLSELQLCMLNKIDFDCHMFFFFLKMIQINVCHYQFNEVFASTTLNFFIIKSFSVLNVFHLSNDLYIVMYSNY